jgi:hypothetical protein
MESDTEHHDLGGFDERGDGVTGFELHFAGSVGGDDGCDDLATDGKFDLGHEALDFEIDDAADELIASADGAHHLALGRVGTLRFVEHAVELGFGDAVVAAGSLNGFDFLVVDPLLDGGVGDSEAQCCFSWSEERCHAAILYDSRGERIRNGTIRLGGEQMLGWQ